MGFIGCPGDDLLQFLIEEAVVLVRVETDVVFGEEAKDRGLCHPIVEGVHAVCMVGDGMIAFSHAASQLGFWLTSPFDIGPTTSEICMAPLSATRPELTAAPFGMSVLVFSATRT